MSDMKLVKQDVGIWVNPEIEEPDESGNYWVRMHTGSIAPKVVEMNCRFEKVNNNRSKWHGATDWNYVEAWLKPIKQVYVLTEDELLELINTVAKNLQDKTLTAKLKDLLNF